MKKWYQYGLLFTFLCSLSFLTTGCFGGLDDAQKTTATFVNNFYAKSDNPSSQERYNKIVSLVSPSMERSPANPDEQEGVLRYIQKCMTFGINKPYYIADAPNQPQSDTRRTIIARVPKGGFANSKEVNSGDNSKDAYQMYVINKEGDEWKIADMENVTDEDISKDKIEWKEVDPTDYLD